MGRRRNRRLKSMEMTMVNSSSWNVAHLSAFFLTVSTAPSSAPAPAPQRYFVMKAANEEDLKESQQAVSNWRMLIDLSSSF